MNGVIRTLLIMSVSGGVVALILLAAKPLLKYRVPKAAQYYLWLVVIAALLVPLSVFVRLPARNGGIIEQYIVNDYVPMETSDKKPISSVTAVIMLIYAAGALIVMFYFVIGYVNFTGHYRLRNSAARESERLILSELCENRRIPHVCRNQLALVPMLVGLLRPVIILPDRDYDDERLRAVLLHELTHMRRKDVIVKWLSVVACAVHWFNPVVWLVRREIDRACELACDEAVIGNLDTEGKLLYGDTLLYVAANAKAPRAVLSTTMCEEKESLKERLGAIMNIKKYTYCAVIASVSLFISAALAVCVLGAGSAHSGAGTVNEQSLSINAPENSSDGNIFNLSSLKNGLEAAPTENAPRDLPALFK